jgi:hypothetical protein
LAGDIAPAQAALATATTRSVRFMTGLGNKLRLPGYHG